MHQQSVVVVRAAGSPADRYTAALEAFTDQRECWSGAEAMQQIESTPARLLIIEQPLDDMQATDLADMVRDIDSELARFTYIIVVGESLTPDLRAAFATGIDAFVSTSDLDAITHTMLAGARLSSQLNSVVIDNAALVKEREILVAGQLLDPLTGLGNRKFAEQALDDSIAQIESRGGAACVLMISIDNKAEVEAAHDERIANELIIAIAERLNSLVRPMDTVTYFDDGLFALILVQPSIEHCTAECYERIFDGVRLKSYRTSIGYVDPRIGMSICASHAENGPPMPERMIRTAKEGLEEAASLQQIRVVHLSEQTE